MKIEAGKSYVLKTVVSTHSIYLRDKTQQQQYITTAINKKVSSAGSYVAFSAPSRWLSLPVVRPSSLFHAAGPRFGMTKGKIWLIVKFLLFFLWHLLCPPFPSTRACWLGDGRWIREERDGEKQSRTGTTRTATATQGGTKGQVRPTCTSSVMFAFFLLTSSTHLLLSGCLFRRVQ